MKILRFLIALAMIASLSLVMACSKSTSSSDAPAEGNPKSSGAQRATDEDAESAAEGAATPAAPAQQQ